MRLFKIFLLVFFFKTTSFAANSFEQIEQDCDHGSMQNPNSKYLNAAFVALAEHKKFPGHEIDENGRLWRYGNDESEMAKTSAGSVIYSWELVKGYWDHLSRIRFDQTQSLKSFKFHAVTTSAYKNIDKINLSKSLNSDELNSLTKEEREILNQSMDRAAITDTPWSAAFISFVISTGAQLKLGSEFAYSQSHSTYINEAILSTFINNENEYSYRACDPYKTRLRVGDLLCYTRFVVRKSDGTIDAEKSRPNFKKIVQTITHQPSQYESHCDIVTAVSDENSTIDVVGGNVFQSVTRKKLRITQDGVLNLQYLNSSSLEYYTQENLNQKNWTILLQSK